MAGCCEHGSEPSGCIKLGEFSAVWGTTSFSRTANCSASWSQSDTTGHSRIKKQSSCYSSGNTPCHTIDKPLTHHWHDIGKTRSHHRHTLGTPSTRHWHTIGTTSEHHSHTTGTHLAHHWHILGTLLAHNWYTPDPTAGMVAVTMKTSCCMPLNNWAIVDKVGWVAQSV